MKYIIEGGRKLIGETLVSGSKNASLPILAASLLSGSITKLYNVPNIHDTQMTIKILRLLGCKVAKKGNKVVIDSKMARGYEIPEDLMRQMRSSVILAGALVGRFKKATFTCPGGCDLGKRPIDLHLKGLRGLGINISEEGKSIYCTADEIIGTKIELEFPSVGATENIMLAAVLADGETIISNAAKEPEICDLETCLNKMWAKVSGSGTSTIKIVGVKKLKDTSHHIMPDRIEAGTLLAAGAITKGKITLKNVIPEHLTPVLHKLEECGCKLCINKNSIILEAPKRLNKTEIETMPYPGFPTDMQSVFVSLLCVSKGTSTVVENIFENRYKYVNELKKMGAKISIEGKTLKISGVKKLKGTEVLATDLRGGAAEVVARFSSKRKNKSKQY